MISKILFYSISNSRCYAVVSKAVVTKDTFIYTHDKLYYIVSPSMIHSADTVSIREGTMHVKIVYFKSMTKTVFSRPLWCPKINNAKLCRKNYVHFIKCVLKWLGAYTKIEIRMNLTNKFTRKTIPLIFRIFKEKYKKSYIWFV